MMADESRLPSIDLKKLKSAQERISSEVIIKPLVKEPATIAGVDSAFFDGRIITVVCLYTWPGLEKIEEAHAISKVEFPYIPGYLSFREGPNVLSAIRRLECSPDILLLDGQGIAHPRKAGIASYAGVELGLPAIGCAKKRLVGEYDEPSQKRGSWSRLRYQGMIIGAVLRTRENVKPVFISPGHLIDLEGAIRIAFGCCMGFRLPEPIRCADRLSKTAGR